MCLHLLLSVDELKGIFIAVREKVVQGYLREDRFGSGGSGHQGAPGDSSGNKAMSVDSQRGKIMKQNAQNALTWNDSTLKHYDISARRSMLA